MITASLMLGSAESGVMVCTPSPGMLKVIVSTTPALAFESRIACRNDPDPVSSVLVTGISTATAVCAIATSARDNAANARVTRVYELGPGVPGTGGLIY